MNKPSKQLQTAFEKVNPSHPDKIADRIAGALVDLAYKQSDNPKVAVELTIGHGECFIINETSVHLGQKQVEKIVQRITESKDINVRYKEVPQDEKLAKNQKEKIRCGDNGVFVGRPVNFVEKTLSDFAREAYKKFPSDGKFVISNLAGEEHLLGFKFSQSKCTKKDFGKFIEDYFEKVDSGKLRNLSYLKKAINPLGAWTGGIDVDSGAVNRKLGSDLGASIVGGGIHGKDLSKADVSVTVFLFLLAQAMEQEVFATTAIGDEKVTCYKFDEVDGKKVCSSKEYDYEEIVDSAGAYITKNGGFEKLAEWGLVAPSVIIEV